MKKLICFILCVCILFAFSGCRKKADIGSSSDIAELNSSVQNNSEQAFSLLYSYSDSFNPYTAVTSANRRISSLIYDSLVKTDNDFNAVYVLASAVEMTDKTCTVKLRDAHFTDGTTVTASDVIYSYNLAKDCTRYSYNFYEVTSVSSPNSKTVVFTLSQCDPYFENLLDFPIIKSGTSGITDADGKEIPPTGCGRYYISDDRLSLILNKNYYGKIGTIETIKLINSPDSDSTSHYVEIGATQMYYTENDAIVRMSGQKISVNLNRLVYVGINASYGLLQSKEMRYAISSALDRDAICRSAYYNNAMSATGYFNPYFEPVSAVQTIESKPNSKITVENLSKIGYNNMNSDGYYANSGGNYPTFTLLVNSENASRVAAANLIASQCKSVGIKISVVECTYEQYLSRLESGDFQLYLGEVQIASNMDFTNLVTEGGTSAYGVAYESVKSDATADTDPENSDSQDTQPQTDGCTQILTAYHNGECGISDVAGVLLTEMPQIPICYLSGALFYDADIKGEVKASVSDIYLSIENYEF